MRSAGTSFMPSGTQILLSTLSPSASPMRWATWRQAMQWSIQKRRMASSGLDRVSPFFTMGWEKQVGLKSMPKPCSLANSTQGMKYRYAVLSRSAHSPSGKQRSWRGG